MPFYHQHHIAQSTQPMYETCYVMKSIQSMGYTNEPIQYVALKESELNPMSLAFAEKAFTEGWDAGDLEQNEYWNSL